MIKFFSGKSSPITLLMALQKKGYTSSGSQVECGDESATANKRTIFQGQFGKYKANCYGDGKKSAESKKDFKRRSMALHVPLTTLYVSQPLHPTQRCKSPNFTFIRKTNSIGFDVGLYLGCIQDELLVIGSLCYTQRVLGSSRGQQRKLLQRNVWRKIDQASKKQFFREFRAVLQPFYQKRIKAMLIRGKCKFKC